MSSSNLFWFMVFIVGFGYCSYTLNISFSLSSMNERLVCMCCWRRSGKGAGDGYVIIGL